ncbi:hypothetical protein CISIN_1g033162mg [Citrus sinensis]|uniref:Uncharacterized protein n=1 Tax=Citrus sinensis TaxID=2711 RepID=A0A067FPE4_CITSI|nr:hypothetical protein CISIN_1g033162mg [Citrus sinensis]
MHAIKQGTILCSRKYSSENGYRSMSKVNPFGNTQIAITHSTTKGQLTTSSPCSISTSRTLDTGKPCSLKPLLIITTRPPKHEWITTRLGVQLLLELPESETLEANSFWSSSRLELSSLILFLRSFT